MPGTLTELELGEGVVQLTLSRPAVRNAIDLELANALLSALQRLEADANTRAIVLAGAGGSFSAGYDIDEMRALNAEQMLSTFLRRDPLLWAVANNTKPVIACIVGPAFGAGALIAAAADIRVGGMSASFCVTATRYGSANATWLLPQLVGDARAKEILMTGRAVPAQEMLLHGLLHRLVADDEALAEAVRVAQQIAANPPAGVAAVKRLINEGHGRSLLERFHAEQAFVSGSLAAATSNVFGPRAAKDKKS